MIRLLEMFESTSIMDQVIQKLPVGPIYAPESKLLSNPRGKMKWSMESMINHFKLFTEQFSIPTNIIYQAVEAPKGEFAITLVTDGSNHPVRCKIKAPGFYHLQALNIMARKHLLADLVAIIGTQDIVFGEIDR
jgi:NADH-quinone oxidoreductase subunit D